MFQHAIVDVPNRFVWMRAFASPARPRPRIRRKGFTLVELLVTVGIVALLAALLLPAGFKLIESANSSKCMGNLKQLASAATLYSADNGGKLVPRATGTGSSDAVTFRIYLMPYVAGSWSVFVCPSDTWAKKQNPSAYADLHGTTPTSYAINGAYFNFINGVSLPFPGYHEYLAGSSEKKLSSIPHPAATIFLCDLGRPDSVTSSPKDWTEKLRAISNASFGYASMPVSGAASWGAGVDSIYPRHAGGRANVAYYDGHVASIDLVKDLIAHPPGDPACQYDYH